MTSGQIERERRLRKNAIHISDYTICHFCKSTGLKENDKYCPNCNFPQRGSQVEMKMFLNEIKQKEQLLKDKKKAVKKARNILYILAVLNLIAGVVMGLIIENDMVVLIASLIGASIYFGLAEWSKRNAFAAILSGFFVYVVFVVIAAIDNPNTIYQGFLWKIIIIAGFIYGYRGVKESEKIESELNSMKKPTDLSEVNAV